MDLGRARKGPADTLIALNPTLTGQGLALGNEILVRLVGARLSPSAVVDQPAEHVAHDLDGADDENDEDDDDDHDVGVVAPVAVLDGEIAQAPAADRAGHGRVAQEGDDGDRGGLDEGRQGLAHEDAPGDLGPRGAHHEGGLGRKIITEETRQTMREVLADIQNGTFASEFVREMNAGKGTRFLTTRKKECEHPLCKVGAELREMMSWLQK